MGIFRDRQKRSFTYRVDTFLVHKDEELIDHLNAWGGDGYQAINIENLGPGLMSTKKNPNKKGTRLIGGRRREPTGEGSVVLRAALCPSLFFGSAFLGASVYLGKTF